MISILVGGLEHFVFPYIGNFITQPTNSIIFQRGRSITNQYWFTHIILGIPPIRLHMISMWVKQYWWWLTYPSEKYEFQLWYQILGIYQWYPYLKRRNPHRIAICRVASRIDHLSWTGKLMAYGALGAEPRCRGMTIKGSRRPEIPSCGPI